uniref:hypothetical protein n=1 Tax=Flavobacterium sp. TaxID=239 RepID=UPI00404A54C2
MKKPIFVKAVIALTFCSFMGIYLINRANKPKADFNKLSGKITHLVNELPGYDGGYDGKSRYLQIENSNRIFNIFVGRESGDFKPEYEIIDSLKVGDIIDLYYDDNFQTKSDQVNNLTRYIDKNGKPYFIKGDLDRSFGIFAIVISLLCIVALSILKKKGKIA